MTRITGKGCKWCLRSSPSRRRVPLAAGGAISRHQGTRAGGGAPDCRKILRKRIRLSVGELGLVLAEDDKRWELFDLTPPAVVNERRRQARAKAAASPETDSGLQVLESGESAAEAAVKAAA